ncbi:MAG: tryptophan--tRNA ligase [Candidatus Saccharibacteria bacterium]
MTKPVILTGLRANNDLHIGNYLGALLPTADMARDKADDYQINLFVPDLHSFTTPIDHRQLPTQVMQNLRFFVAAGVPLLHENVFIYRQSYIAAHSELTWILDCFTGFGEMSRMTQFKERAAKPAPSEASDPGQGSTSVGMFNYPVLMAADILLYGASYVPVGDDQTQHLEFTRDIAQRLNKKFDDDLFVVPKPVTEQNSFFGKDQGLRIRNLQDPTKKMSKSDESARGNIFLSDTPATATKKIMEAVTDSVGQVQVDYNAQPGVSNLLDIFRLLGGSVDEFIGQVQYGPLKTAVAQTVSDFLTDFQTKLAAVDDAAILHKLEASEYLMREVAGQRLHAVQRAVGLRP